MSYVPSIGSISQKFSKFSRDLFSDVSSETIGISGVKPNIFWLKFGLPLSHHCSQVYCQILFLW